MPKAVCRQIGDEFVIVPISGDIAKSSDVFSTNAVGARIWELSTQGRATNTESLAQELQAHFGIDAPSIDCIKADVEEFLRELATCGLLDE